MNLKKEKIRKNYICNYQTYQCLWHCSKKQRKRSLGAALAGDPESAFGGVLVSNDSIDKATADAIEIYFLKC